VDIVDNVGGNEASRSAWYSPDYNLSVLFIPNRFCELIWLLAHVIGAFIFHHNKFVIN